jgi:phospholipid/cholesterol/gamma-HCH transport system permease protein
MPLQPATLTPSPSGVWVLAGDWTAAGLGGPNGLATQGLATQQAAPMAAADASAVTAMDTAGAWWLQGRLAAGAEPTGLLPRFAALLALARSRQADQLAHPDAAPPAAPGALARLGQQALGSLHEALGLLGFVGTLAEATGACLKQPRRIRWRTVLFHLRAAGVDALPIVGLLAFLLGVVVAYQGAVQLRQYGASIFVADLVGLSMLREFAPLITAIIAAGRSGSSYAAQIGTMAVTEEIDAMRTLGIAPLELLVLPRLLALVVALPLLTVFADVLGVLGGMAMAQTQLGVGFAEFIERLGRAVSVSSLLVGIGKAPLFAAVIAVVGCYQGLQTRGGPDSVGRQTTRSVVQAIFLVIVTDALFSVTFNALDL